MFEFRKSSLSTKEQLQMLFKNKKMCRKDGNTEIANFEFRPMQENQLFLSSSLGTSSYDGHEELTNFGKEANTRK